MISHVFISHVEDDAEIASEIAQSLEKAGYKTWYYERDTIPGASYLLTVSLAIEQSEAVVIVISPRSLSSRQVTVEVMRAHEAGKRFIPLLVDLSHSELKKCQPEWLEAIGNATTISVSRDDVTATVRRIIAGLSALETKIEDGDAQGKYRIFISYSHEDLGLAEKIVAIISGNRLTPMWDKDFVFGHGFQEQIKTFIAHSHVFLPIITTSSSERGWVHQEIGYAMALNVPVLPLCVGALPGEMIRELHAVQFTGDFRELQDKLSSKNIEKLVESYKDNSFPLYHCAELTEDRAIMMAKYANDVLQLKPVLKGEAYGCVRQKGGLSSFHIPDNLISHPIWDQRYGPLKRSKFHYRLQREERLALERHARVGGCRLIINPYLTYDEYGTSARISRLNSLLMFLETMPNDKVQVAINEKSLNESVTIVGDWFAAQAVSAEQGQGYQQTIFTRHAPSISKKIEEFDQEFKELLKEWNWKPESSREVAINKIKEIIADIEKK
jgi:hypothetical protein